MMVVWEAETENGIIRQGGSSEKRGCCNSIAAEFVFEWFRYLKTMVRFVLNRTERAMENFADRVW
ncbi:hypothetical protein HMPREF2572_05175 [Neisseria sp. HMSC064E01]|nr:hypothetical protein HMPREF2572_05175 [Neisseria sp. HMSC064E01]